jgi:NADPH:quinone reductase-like Zn-dependent oxidoreductase
MKRVIISKIGGPEVLQVIEAAVPQPRNGEALIRVQSSGVAFAEVLMREGLYPNMPKPPFTPGYDVVGVVEQVGTDVTTVRPGQTVAALLTHLGGYAEYVSVPEHDLVAVPAGIEPAEAVSLVLNYLTAYQLLHRTAHVTSGDRILVHGAAGGVGTALLQLGRLAGLEMYGTASKGKHALVRKLGATPIDYRSSDFVAEIRRLSKGEGIDMVFDAVGGRQWQRSFQTLREGGKLVAYGFSTATSGGRRSLAKAGLNMLRMPRFDPLSLLNHNRAVMGYNVNKLKARYPDWYREDLSTLLKLLADGKIKPVIGAQVPLAEVAHAHQLLNDAAISGKIVLMTASSAGR